MSLSNGIRESVSTPREDPPHVCVSLSVSPCLCLTRARVCHKEMSQRDKESCNMYIICIQVANQSPVTTNLISSNEAIRLTQAVEIGLFILTFPF